MRYDQLGLSVLASGYPTKGRPLYIMTGQENDMSLWWRASALIFLGVAAGSVALVYLFKGGLWALGTAVALGGGLYLWEQLNRKAPVYGPQSPTTQAPMNQVPPNQVFRQIPGGIVGFMGEGYYQVVDPKGLGLFSGPTMTRPAIQTLPYGSMVRVFASSENNYVQVDQPAPGFMCMSCAENPGGPWLIRKS